MCGRNHDLDRAMHESTRVPCAAARGLGIIITFQCRWRQLSQLSQWPALSFIEYLKGRRRVMWPRAMQFAYAKCKRQGVNGRRSSFGSTPSAGKSL